MLSIHTTSQESSSLPDTFLPWEIALYIRDFLRGTPLSDHALVDNLIDATGRSSTAAALSCVLLKFGSDLTAQDRLRVLLGHRSCLAPDVGDEMLGDILRNHNTEFSAEPNHDLPINIITKLIKNSANAGPLHSTIARGCISVMHQMLRFNICSIPSSYLSNDTAEVDQLFHDAQRKGYINSALLYACSHWVYHTSFVPFDAGLTEILISFLGKLVLQWLEVAILAGQDPMTIALQLHKLPVSENSLLST